MHRVTNELHFSNDTFSTTEINSPCYTPNFSVFDLSQNKWSDDIQLINKYSISVKRLLTETGLTEESILLSKKTGYQVKQDNFFSKV